MGNLLQVTTDQLSETENDLLTAHQRRLRPGRKTLLQTLHRRFHLRLRRLGHARHNLIGRGIVQVNPVLSLRLHKLTVDEQLRRRLNSKIQ